MVSIDRELADKVEVTVDDGYLHVATGNFGAYQGSINSYNNFFTQTIAWLFDVSVKINAGGEEHRVNRKSYVEFLENRGVDTRTLTNAEFHNLDVIPFTVTVRADKPFMRQNLTANTTRELAKKLFAEIAAGNGGGVEKYVRKGADLNMRAWYNEDARSFIFAEQFATELPKWTLNPQRFSELTPHLLSLRVSQIGFANFIFFAGANVNLPGKTCLFSRQLVDERNNWSMQPAVRLTTEQYVDAHGVMQQRLATKSGLDVVSTKVKKFQDSYSEQFDIYYDPTMPSNLAYVSKPSLIHEWDTSRKNGALQLF